MMDSLTDDDYLWNYQINRQKENLQEPFNTAIHKRRCLILTLAHSSERLNNATSCHIFEDQLLDYVEHVDNRKGINNYAKATLEIMSNIKNISKSWKSGLPNDFSNVQNVWEPLKEECENSKIKGLCGSSLPPSLINHIVDLSKTEVDERPHSSKGVVQTTLDSYKKTSSSAGDVGNTRSLYCQYSDVKKLDSALPGPKPVSQQSVPPVFKRNTLSHSLYAEPKISSRIIEQRETYSKQGSQTWKNKKKGSLYSEYSDNNKEAPEQSGIYNQPFPGGKGYYRNNKPLFSRMFENSNDDSDRNTEREYETHFKTAGHELKISNQKKFGNNNGVGRASHYDDNERRLSSMNRRTDFGRGGNDRNIQFQPQSVIKKSLGGKRSVTSKFVPPVRNNSEEDDYRSKEEMMSVDPESELDERLKNIEPRMIELIKNEIMDTGSNINWDDIAGLHFAKTTIQEIVVWPMLRPDIFTGLRRPPKGILLFGPPGTGKTLIGKCIASQSNSTFFSISASSLTSKWIGDGEKMVRALFAVARCHQPAVVFIDEIDSLLSQRSDTEHESSRRIKTEFLVQLDGASTGDDDRILVIGATNRPQELDEAARRRLVKRLYIPLPDIEARKQLVKNLMKLERNELTNEHIDEVAHLTDGYSGADMKNLCQEASLGPIRSIASKDMFQISAEQVRPVNIDDFKTALKRVKSSVSSQDLELYLKWDYQYGSGAA